MRDGSIILASRACLLWPGWVCWALRASVCEPPCRSAQLPPGESWTGYSLTAKQHATINHGTH